MLSYTHCATGPYVAPLECAPEEKNSKPYHAMVNVKLWAQAPNPAQTRGANRRTSKPRASRGAKIYGELTGYAANADGYDVVAPSGVGGENCMKLAMAMASESPNERIPRERHQAMYLSRILSCDASTSFVCAGPWEFVLMILFCFLVFFFFPGCFG